MEALITVVLLGATAALGAWRLRSEFEREANLQPAVVQVKWKIDRH